jgi:hypothetical protein
MGINKPDKLKEEKEVWQKNKDALSKDLILVTNESDIINNIKPGQDAKFVVTKDGKVIVYKDNKNPHSLASAAAGGEVGEDIQAGGHMKYYVGQGILFDLKTGHYQIDDYGKADKDKAIIQAKKAFESIKCDVNDPGKKITKPDKNTIDPRWEDNVDKFKDDKPERK